MRETDSDWYTRHFNEDYRTLYAARNDAEAGVQTAFAIEQLEIQPDDRVLDLCCGHGRHLEALAGRNIRATGVDLSLPLLKEALARGIHRHPHHRTRREGRQTGELDPAPGETLEEGIGVEPLDLGRALRRKRNPDEPRLLVEGEDVVDRAQVERLDRVTVDVDAIHTARETLKRAMATALVSLSAILLVTLEHSLTPGPQRLHLIWILASFSFGLLSAFLLEKAHKRMFLQQDSLELSASLDGLTGLWNRSRTEAFLADEQARANRYGTPFSVVLIDIDHFKHVNDTFGHAVGDSVLRQFATLLRENVRAVDKVGRFGGEEFLIVLPEIGSHQAVAAVQALRRRIQAFAFDTVERKTASFGIAEYRPGETLEALMARADKAMYRAKASGRDRVEAL